jgi:hypothetical protein
MFVPAGYLMTNRIVDLIATTVTDDPSVIMERFTGANHANGGVGTCTVDEVALGVMNGEEVLGQVTYTYEVGISGGQWAKTHEHPAESNVEIAIGRPLEVSVNQAILLTSGRPVPITPDMELQARAAFDRYRSLFIQHEEQNVGWEY